MTKGDVLLLLLKLVEDSLTPSHGVTGVPLIRTLDVDLLLRNIERQLKMEFPPWVKPTCYAC